MVRKHSAKTRKKISRALDARVTSKEERGLTTKQKLSIGAGVSAAALLGGAAYAAKKGKLKVPGFKQKIEPLAVLPKKASLGIAQTDFVDATGRFRSKGKMLPGLKKGQTKHLSIEPHAPLKGKGVVFIMNKSGRKLKAKSALNKVRKTATKEVSKLKTTAKKYKPYATKALSVARDAAYVANSAVRLKKAFGFNRNAVLMEFKRTRTAKEKAAISKGLKVYWDSEGKERRQKASDKGARIGATVGLASLLGAGYAADKKFNAANKLEDLVESKNKRASITNIESKYLNSARSNLEHLYKGADSNQVASLKRSMGKPNMRPKATSISRNLRSKNIARKLHVGGYKALVNTASTIRKSGRGIARLPGGKSPLLAIGALSAGGLVGAKIATSLYDRKEKKRGRT